MRLLVDIGNSRIKWGWSVSTGEVHDAHSCEDLGILLDELQQHQAPSETWIADVRGGNDVVSLLNFIETMHWQKPRMASSRAALSNLRVGYMNPESLGVDRFLALAAATAAQSLPAIVISVGTATTIDGVGADGAHGGGVILPGKHMIINALNHAVPRLKPWMQESEEGILYPWAVETGAALRNGMLYAWASAVERVITDMQKQLGIKCLILLTGGDGLMLQRHLKFDTQYDEHLILRGLSYL